MMPARAAAPPGSPGMPHWTGIQMDEAGDARAAECFRQTADAWNAKIEAWTYVMDTELARQVGVEGYYARIAPSAHIVSPDALALVRFGLRAADDPRILNTVPVIDAILKTETAAGPVWHRYSHDGYGEHDDGAAFDGAGVGRGWPLLAGERAHYEAARGRQDEARRLLQAMAAQATTGGLIPEQGRDALDIPTRELGNGRPSGSAMPLVWAHAEYLKLRRSLRDGRVVDLPTLTMHRHQVEKVTSPFAIWRFHHQCRCLTPGHLLRVEGGPRRARHEGRCARRERRPSEAEG